MTAAVNLQARRNLIYPYERFIIYRVLRGDTFEELNGHLRNFCIPLVKANHWEQAKKQLWKLNCPIGLKIVLNKCFPGEIPESAREWLRKHNLDTLLLYEEDDRSRISRELYEAMAGVYCIHEYPFARLAINVLLINKLPYREISEAIERDHREKFSEKSIELYAFYFWDSKKQTQRDWGEYIDLLVSKERALIFKALTKRLEDIKLEIGLASKIEYSDFLRQCLEISDYKVRNLSMQNTEVADRQALGWMGMGIVAGEKFTKYSRGDSGSLFRELLFEIEHVESPVMNITPEIASALALNQNSFQSSKQEVEPQLNPPLDLVVDPDNV